MSNRLIAIGDIHGCYDTMVTLMSDLKIDFDHDTVVLLGDYIDRGLFPVKVVKAIKELTNKHPNNVIALMGNHEKMCIDAFHDRDSHSLWMYNGGRITESQLMQEDETDRDSILYWMSNLPLRYELDKYRFCHSGWWGDELDKYGEKKVLWSRDWLYDENISPAAGSDKTMIFGHTPLRDAIWVDDKSIDIDTGAFSGNKLTAVIIEDDNPQLYDVETVNTDIGK